ncbi:PucR family transcriptional regulator [Isobaculum melis]|uniref:PucR C-terminal helix-turn-helix domain-containing protein n=1 Tax=Isobaculum melis TaxID=142588 RepID=A0A1H9Q278_9LACT|nr:PucR family transcriptional regulator [Isobaculum melis]SER54185.1 PucR C-terminal helix-turn-helix domain-containing protein [Isobaculum melis]
MTIRVKDLLSLPSMKHTRLIGGDEGKNKVVSSISVLESTDPKVLKNMYFNHAAFRVDEILITGFINNPDKINEQCECVLGLSKAGASGLIIFYEGLVLKEIDSKLVDLANQLGFPLLVMQKNKIILYGEVISDVQGLLHRDSKKIGLFSKEIIKRMSLSEKSDQNGDYLLRLISNKYHYSIALITLNNEVVFSASWPLSSEIVLQQINNGDVDYQGTNSYYKQLSFEASDIKYMYLKNEYGNIDEQIVLEIIEILQIFSTYFKFKRPTIDELGSSLLNDHIFKRQRLAKYFKINLDTIEKFWIITNLNHSIQQVEKISLLLKQYYKIVIVSSQDEDTYFFLGEEQIKFDYLELIGIVNDELKKLDNCKFYRQLEKFSFDESRRQKQAYREHRHYVEIIFPYKQMYTSIDLDFIEKCVVIIEGEKQNLDAFLYPLSPLLDEKEERRDELLLTLQTLLLDTDLILNKAANLLDVHIGTVKYRLKTLNNLLGYDIRHTSNLFPIYLAVGLYRMIHFTK